MTLEGIPDEERRRRVLHLTCCLLPKSHRDTMEVLFNFLQWVSSFSHVDEESGSKMDIHNLATVITPNILHLGKREVPLDDNLLAIEAVHTLIEFNEYMCEVSSLSDIVCTHLRCILLMCFFPTGARGSLAHSQRLLSFLCYSRHYDQRNP